MPSEPRPEQRRSWLRRARVSYTLATNLRPGRILGARYEVLAPLGRGGMGTVFRARDRVSGRPVAVKVLGPEWAERRDMRERFRTEMQLAQKVRHRNVCRILDCGEDGRRLYLVTELVEGIDLKRLLARSGGLPAEHAFEGAIQIARGLQAVHDAGIVHRDVKSPNVIVDRSGRFRLLDFDLAERVEDAARGAGGQVHGTPEYMSPEQARGDGVAFASDVYSLGVVVFELFTGDLPFKGDTAAATVRKQVEDAPPLTGPKAARLPPPLLPILRKSLDKDPTRRYPRARSLVEALRLARSTVGLADATPATDASHEGFSALLGALNPRDATVRLEPRPTRAFALRQSREAMARLVAALTREPDAG
ncbi:MAG TPA: serine/threonine-protein kinase [Vicinamibacteria bacterium]|nr:serine/threonine-protein kinase [Vicinamibacteria bacterium]